MTDARLPTKKQRELLSFIDGFIKGNGYGPSYREIMRSLDYKSVSTVATHVDGLIARGYVRKRDNSARSLEVVGSTQMGVDNAQVDSHRRWYEARVEDLRAGDLSGDDTAALIRVSQLLFPDKPS